MRSAKMSSGSKRINLHFIPNTHIDREWAMDFQHNRGLTVDFIDNLIEIMKQIPEYCFLLDSQVIPLEDYLEIRPENKNILIRFIKENRLNIGPWYTAMDMNCVNGESIVRNLLFGHKIMEKYGPIMKVGYTPFGWGQVSQLPQIYQGFGIETCLFYRGITPDQAPVPKFFWEGADGTTLFCSLYYNWSPGIFMGE